MKPVSMASSRSPSMTRWVSAWPPRRSSASKSVTCALREATYAAVSPATPEPMTATRCGAMALSIEAEERDDVVARLGRLLVGFLDGDAGAVGARGVSAEQDLVVRALGHDAGRHHHLVVLEPQ